MPVTGFAVVLDGGTLARQVLPAIQLQFLVAQLDLGQVFLHVDGRLLGVTARRKLLGPVVLVQRSWGRVQPSAGLNHQFS